MRILICEDSALLREGLVRVLEDAGHVAVAALPDASHLDETVAETKPDLCIIDVRLPPSWTDEGIRAALALRALRPELAVLVLSQYVEERYAADLIADSVPMISVTAVAKNAGVRRPDRGRISKANPMQAKAAAL